MNKLAITADGTCDLPIRLMKEKEINLIYFDLKTEHGVFRDVTEISEKNILEYMADGTHKVQSTEPTPLEYKRYFIKLLKKYDEIVHISVGAKISAAYERASLARAQLGIDGQRIHIVNSGQLSSGMGLVVLEAVRLRDEGCSAKDVVAGLVNYDKRIYTSFISQNADFLYYNGRVSKGIMELTKRFNVHPVLHVVDGELKLKSVMFGNYNGVYKRYVKKLLKNTAHIDWSSAILTYAGIPLTQVDLIEEYIQQYISFENLIKQPACAIVSATCGPGSFGIIIRKH